MERQESSPSPAISPYRVLRVGGAIIAFLIGSGFASGQEIFQFLTAYGTKGIIGSVLAMALFCLVSGILVSYGYRAKDDEDANPYYHYLGRYFGEFMRWYTPFFALLINIVMISGAGATLNQYFGLDPRIGTLAMTIVVTVVALFGLRRVVDIISLLGPLTIIFTLFISIYTLITNPGDFSTANQVLASMDNVPYGAGNSPYWWWLGAGLFVAYNIVAGVPFMTELGANEVRSNREAWAGGIAGGVGLMSAALALNLAMLGHVDTLVDSQVPVLALAQDIGPTVGFIFAFILLEEIFSTSAPMLWTVVESITNEETPKSRINVLIVLVSILSLIGAQLPFGTLVGIVYPFTGYFGLVMIALFIIKEIKTRKQA